VDIGGHSESCLLGVENAPPRHAAVQALPFGNHAQRRSFKFRQLFQARGKFFIDAAKAAI
jgi:hypothetical protein